MYADDIVMGSDTKEAALIFMFSLRSHSTVGYSIFASLCLLLESCNNKLTVQKTYNPNPRMALICTGYTWNHSNHEYWREQDLGGVVGS